MAQGDDFRLAVNPRPEEPCDRTPDQPEYVRHRQQASPNFRSLASQIEFAVGTGVASFLPDISLEVLGSRLQEAIAEGLGSIRRA